MLNMFEVFSYIEVSSVFKLSCSTYASLVRRILFQTLKFNFSKKLRDKYRYM